MRDEFHAEPVEAFTARLNDCMIVTSLLLGKL